LKRNYGLDGKASDMLFFVMQNDIQGRSKMIGGVILDKRWR